MSNRSHPSHPPVSLKLIAEENNHTIQLIKHIGSYSANQIIANIFHPIALAKKNNFRSSEQLRICMPGKLTHLVGLHAGSSVRVGPNQNVWFKRRLKEKFHENMKVSDAF